MHQLVVRLGWGIVLFGVLAFSIKSPGRLSGLGEQSVEAQTEIQLVPVASNLSSPVLVRNSHDGSHRLFIVEQPGRILVLPPGAASPLSTPFLDIRTKVSFSGERGLLGLTFHPQFASNRRFFINYTRAGDGATVISEFKASASDNNLAGTEEKTILTIAQPFSNHNGGMIDFGPDGYLYIGMGDGGSANDPGNRSQNLDELLGKMLRIDIDPTGGTAPYASPPTNPYFGATPGRDEIYAVGLRNPWRWSFDRATGQLYAGDVGQGVIEEISIITRGGNYGWRVFEGTRCTNLGPAACNPNNFTPPVVEYDHSNNRCSVTGGYVYRGTSSTLPAGSYVYGDFCTGEIFLLQNNSASLLLDTNMQLASFGEDESGEIYVVGLEGRIFRIARPGPLTPVSAANYRGETLAVESIAAAFGNGMATGTQASSTTPLPTTLAGAGVRVRDSAGVDRTALLFYVSPTQINFQVPAGTAAGSATVSITNNGRFGAIASGTVNIANVAPGLFTADSSGHGLAAAVVQRTRADGTQVFEPAIRFEANQYLPVPIDLGPSTDQVFLVLYGAGFRFRSSLTGVTATIGGEPAQVTFAGAQGELIGLDQANLRLPRTLIGRGIVDVALTVDKLPANLVNVSVK